MYKVKLITRLIFSTNTRIFYIDINSILKLIINFYFLDIRYKQIKLL